MPGDANLIIISVGVVFGKMKEEMTLKKRKQKDRRQVLGKSSLYRARGRKVLAEDKKVRRNTQKRKWRTKMSYGSETQVLEQLHLSSEGS